MSSVDVIMTSTVVSGPTAQWKNDISLNHIVRKKYAILFYRASLTVTFRTSWQTFVLLIIQEITCWKTMVFGSMSTQPVSMTFTGLTALYWQVILFMNLLRHHLVSKYSRYNNMSNLILYDNVHWVLFNQASSVIRRKRNSRWIQARSYRPR